MALGQHRGTNARLQACRYLTCLPGPQLLHLTALSHVEVAFLSAPSWGFSGRDATKLLAPPREPLPNAKSRSTISTLEDAQVHRPWAPQCAVPLGKGPQTALIGVTVYQHHAEIPEPILATLLARDPGPRAGKTPPPGTAGNTGLALRRKSPFIGPWSLAKLEPNQPFLQLPKEVSRDLGLVGRGADKGVPWCPGLEALLVPFTTGYVLSVG